MLRYEVRDADGVLIRLFSRREEAEYFSRLDNELCVHVRKQPRKQKIDLSLVFEPALF
jgi:hypothetical protein